MEEDKEISIILGKPFLVTGRGLIDVQKGELWLRVQEEEVIFNVFKATKYPDDEGYNAREDTQDTMAKEIGGVQNRKASLAFDPPRGSSGKSS